MPNILHLETSGPIGSVALSVDGQVVSHIDSQTTNTHAQQITLLIDECLDNAQLDLGALHAISVSKGPGSYTGLRVAASAAKAYCFALDIPLVAIDTLQSLAMAASSIVQNTSAVYIPMIDARRMEVYTGLYDHSGETLSAPYAKIVDETAYSSELADRSAVYCGSGAEKCIDLINGKNAIILSDLDIDARHQAQLAMEALGRGAIESVAYYKPTYLKAPNITTPKPML